MKHEDLPEGWRLFSSYEDTQLLGSAWYQQRQSLLLKVPSAVVPGDRNVLIHAAHQDYHCVKLSERIPFPFDKRFLKMDKELESSRKTKKRKR